MKKNKAIKNAIAVVLLLFSGMVAADSATYAKWEKIDVAPGIYQTTDGNGDVREIAPSCSGGPVCTIDAAGKPNCRLGDKQFSFYYKAGKKKDLVVYFDGGGACWDSNTCVTGQVVTSVGAYVPELKGGPGTQGLFDQANPQNPYRDWSVVAIPYCTGDIHFGSRDQNYTDFTGAVTGIPGGTVTIHHRGFDNFLYVREWLKQRFGVEEGDKKNNSNGEDRDRSNVKHMLVTGSSAGAYGAAFAYPHLKQAFPKTEGYLMADAGNGVVSDTLRQQALSGPDARWGPAKNLVHAIPGMDGIFDLPQDRFESGFNTALARYYPKDRFSQYTTLFDVIQVLFYNISLNQNDIAAWNNIFPVYEAWTQQMVNNAYATAAANPNYRFYIAPGCNHTVLRFNDDFYNTQSGQAPSFLSWFKALTKESDDGVYPANWKNSFCEGCAIPPTPQEVGACLQRTFSN